MLSFGLFSIGNLKEKNTTLFKHMKHSDLLWKSAMQVLPNSHVTEVSQAMHISKWIRRTKSITVVLAAQNKLNNMEVAPVNFLRAGILELYLK